MKITTRHGESSAVVEIFGAINVYSASVVGQTIQSQIADGMKTIILDLSSVSSIDSSGLGTLVGNAKALASAGGSLVLVGANSRVRKMLAITNLDRYFQIEDGSIETVGDRQTRSMSPASCEEVR